MSSEPLNPVVAAFDAAAESYDALTQVQREVARALVARAGAASPGTILDLGAGTGHVTECALRQWPRAELAALDAAPAMLARLRAKFPCVKTIRRDAARLEGVGSFDLILSSMMLHWVTNPSAALAEWRQHLAPEGLLCIAVPVEGSLREWRDLTRASGIEDGLWAFPPEDFGAGLGAEIEILDFPVVYPDVRAFLRTLKGAGAGRPRPGAKPATAGALRRMAKRSGPFTATFRIAFIDFKADYRGKRCF